MEAHHIEAQLSTNHAQAKLLSDARTDHRRSCSFLFKVLPHHGNTGFHRLVVGMVVSGLAFDLSERA